MAIMVGSLTADRCGAGAVAERLNLIHTYKSEKEKETGNWEWYVLLEP